MTEFEVISRYFKEAESSLSTEVPIGEDCAVFIPSPGMNVAVSVDATIEGQHVPKNCHGDGFAHRCLRRSLSDIAAQGAEAKYILLSLTLPSFDKQWLDDFTSAFFNDLKLFKITLLGGDISKGHMAAHVTSFGEVPPGQSLLRNGAQIGDKLVVLGGDLGGARAFLDVYRGSLKKTEFSDVWEKRYWLPEPALNLGVFCRGKVSALIDISDGLAQDLGHIISHSSLSAFIYSSLLPITTGLIETFGLSRAIKYALTGGDDYVLLAAIPEKNLCFFSGIPHVVIGYFGARKETKIWLDDAPISVELSQGWDHSK